MSSKEFRHPESNKNPTVFSSKTHSQQTSFLGDILKLVSGTAFAQVLAVAAYPIIARLFAPEAFGVVALFSSIAGIFTVVACGRYELSIVIPKRDNEAVNLFAVCIIFVVVTASFSILVISLGGNRIVAWLKEPQLKSYLWLIPVSTLFGGTFSALTYWNSRMKLFGRLSISQIIRATGQSGSQVSLGLAGFTTPGGLIGANMFAQFLATFTLAGQVLRDDRRLFMRHVNFQGMKTGLIRHRRFPLYSTWSGLLNNISWQLPVFLLASFFSPTIVGYFALGNRVLHMPMNFIGNAIRQVFYQRAADSKVNGTLGELVEIIFSRLITLGLFPILTVTVIGRDLFVLIFGEPWAEAGVYVQILGIWSFFWFISSPMATLFNVMEKQKFGLVINSLIFGTRLLSLVIGGFSESPRLALILYSVTGTMIYGYLSFSILTTSGGRTSRMIPILIRNIACFIPAGLVLIGLKVMHLAPISIVLAATAFVVIYYVYVISRDPELRPAILRRIR